jgi:hypothetical protein
VVSQIQFPQSLSHASLGSRAEFDSFVLDIFLTAPDTLSAVFLAGLWAGILWGGPEPAEGCSQTFVFLATVSDELFILVEKAVDQVRPIFVLSRLLLILTPVPISTALPAIDFVAEAKFLVETRLAEWLIAMLGHPVHSGGPVLTLIEVLRFIRFGVFGIGEWTGVGHWTIAFGVAWFLRGSELFRFGVVRISVTVGIRGSESARRDCSAFSPTFEEQSGVFPAV